MKTFSQIILFIFLLPFLVEAQTINLSERVTMHYENTPLEDVLTDISTTYNMPFAYSTDIIPIEKRINLHIENEPMAVALDNLFVETYIVYARIGDQVVLKVDEEKFSKTGDGDANQRLSNKGGEIEINPPSEVYRAEEMKSDSPIQTVRIEREKRRNEALAEALPKAIVPGQISEFEIDFNELNFGGALIPDLSKLGENIDWEEISDFGDSLTAKVSFVPSVELKLGKKQDTTNLSLNILWGYATNLNGVQIGTLGNSVDENFEGLQVGLVANTVQGNMVGTQIAGLSNVNRGESIGTQVAGIVNVGDDVMGLQVAGLTNIVNNGFRGIQIAGISNVAHKSTGGIQLAPIANLSNKEIDAQVSFISNKAQTVNIAQIGLVNAGGTVRGVQLGLINFADTSSVSIGLINIVRRGYNRLEVTGGETMHLNASIKLGTKRFYNIFYGGKRWEDNNIWALGYGIGTYLNTGKKTGLNLEALLAHVNEQPNSIDLNMLSRFRMTMDFRIGRRFSLFLGPDFNLITSKLYDPATKKYGSNIMPYTLIDNTFLANKKTPAPVESDIFINMKGWIGINAGLRF